MSAQWPEKDVAELEGKEDLVRVEAFVNHIEDVPRHKPYQKGILGDDSSWGIEPRKFVVWDPDLQLEKGNKYRIFGKDSVFEPLNEIRIEIQDADHVDLLYEGD